MALTSSSKPPSSAPSKTKTTTPAAATSATPATTVTAATATIKKKKHRHIRPRGKRGGIKHHKSGIVSSATSTTTSSDAVVKPSTPLRSEKIAEYHTIQKRLCQKTLSQEERSQLEKQLKQLGGIQAYQKCSIKGAQVGGLTDKWCIQKVAPLLPLLKRKWKVLDVGAIDGTSYTNNKWIEPIHIDLNPKQGSLVIKSDFFQYPLPDSEENSFDLVGLSLVVNFEGNLQKRGKMILHAHQYLRPLGFVYLVLPLSCVTNSRYLTREHLTLMMDSLGFQVVQQSDSNQLTRWLLRRKPSPNDKWDGTVWKKNEISKGVDRNNFCICFEE